MMAVSEVDMRDSISWVRVMRVSGWPESCTRRGGFGGDAQSRCCNVDAGFIAADDGKIEPTTTTVASTCRAWV
jgi:hypothetical protein